MAEFSEVMRQIVRLHNSCTCGCFIPDTEDLCPLYGMDDALCDWINTPPKIPAAQIENVVMSWAAENPEPVYPLSSGKIIDPSYAINGNLYNRIPADIAQKLGIEPKEG